MSRIDLYCWVYPLLVGCCTTYCHSITYIQHACHTTIKLEAHEKDLERLGDVANLLQSGGELLGEVHASGDVIVVVGGEHGFDDLSRDHICKITSCIGEN